MDRPIQRRLSSQLPSAYPPSPSFTSPPDPTVPTTSISKPYEPPLDVTQTHIQIEKEPCCTRFKRFCYNPQEKSFCGRTCSSWLKIITYAIMYLVFQITFFLVLLYISLLVTKSYYAPEKHSDSEADFSYSFESLVDSLPAVIGLTGTPLGHFNYPLIWYRHEESADYNKYLLALDDLLKKNHEKRDLMSNLGPCGKRPYGYGKQPCILVRINRQRRWAVKPLQPKSVKLNEAPKEVQKWVLSDSNKYWLHCEGVLNYDKEHIGILKYYPDPPGFDSKLFPLNENSSVPLVAVQLTNFTLGMSIGVRCSVWYEAGSSDINFVLYVTPKSKYG